MSLVIPVHEDGWLVSVFLIFDDLHSGRCASRGLLNRCRHYTLNRMPIARERICRGRVLATKLACNRRPHLAH
jgi:hypothetical protein